MLVQKSVKDSLCEIEVIDLSEVVFDVKVEKQKKELVLNGC